MKKFDDMGSPYWDTHVLKYAKAYNIPYSLVRGLIIVESEGIVNARSPAGAVGLMQVMPFHFKRGQNPFDPETNIEAGCRVLADCFARTRRWDQALAAYNGSLGIFGHIRDPKYVLDVYNAQQLFAA